MRCSEIVCAILVIILLIMLYAVKEIKRQVHIQSMLLSKMAEKQGVTEDEINSITNQK
jgi:predicted Holliday junction resolvase-like endonuclease